MKRSYQDQTIINMILQFSSLGYELQIDKNGEIVIYTGMKFDEKDRIIPIDDEE